MSEETASSTTSEVTVYVRLLDEGTVVYRPAQAVAVSEGVYRLRTPSGYDAEDEAWEFSPGSIVACECKRVGEDILLVAVGSVGD